MIPIYNLIRNILADDTDIKLNAIKRILGITDSSRDSEIIALIKDIAPPVKDTGTPIRLKLESNHSVVKADPDEPWTFILVMENGRYHVYPRFCLVNGKLKKDAEGSITSADGFTLKKFFEMETDAMTVKTKSPAVLENWDGNKGILNRKGDIEPA